MKIDQSFVQDVIEDPNDASIVTAIIQFGFALQLDIIAEGIETEQQLSYLKQAGCHYGQGYYLSYPLSPDELIKFIGEHHQPIPYCFTSGIFNTQGLHQWDRVKEPPKVVVLS